MTAATTRPGVGVDATGNAVIDPTKNVEDVIAALSKSNAELRAADNRYYDLALSEHRRNDDAGHLHLKEMADLRASYHKEIRSSDLAVAAQTRLVDVGGQAGSAASIATAVQTLATAAARDAQVLRDAVSSTSATLAKQVADTAAAQQIQTNLANAAMDARVAKLELISAQGSGRQSVSEPQMERLTRLVEALSRDQTAGGARIEANKETKDDGRQTTNMIIGVVGLLLALGLAIVGFRSAESGKPQPQPQIIYVPAPAGSLLPTTPPQTPPR